MKQGLAVRGHDDLEGKLLQLLKLRNEDYLDMTSWMRERKYFSSAILNEQITLDNIRSTEISSVIADEAMDVGNKEQMAICIR